MSYLFLLLYKCRNGEVSFARTYFHDVFGGQKLYIKVLVCPQKRSQGHQNLTSSFPCLNGVFVRVWANSTHWFRRKSDEKVHVYSLYSVVTTNIRSRSPNFSKVFNYPNDTKHKVWPESIIWFKI